MRAYYIFLILPFLFLFKSAAYSQETFTSDETSWDVPELFEFHDVIYPIWHTAFPDKNTELLKSYADQVKSGAEKIYNVKLSGILRDKIAKWEEGVKNLKVSVNQYSVAALSKDDQAMLDAAEKLHSDFENLVRIIKPMSKEIDDYHQTLYMIYHYFLPEKRNDDLRSAAAVLLKKADAISKAEIPKRAASKKDEYLKLVEDLYNSSYKLNSSIQTSENEYEDTIEMVEDVHNKYQALEHLFD